VALLSFRLVREPSNSMLVSGLDCPQNRTSVNIEWRYVYGAIFVGQEPSTATIVSKGDLIVRPEAWRTMRRGE